MKENLQTRIAYIKGKLDAFYRVIDMLDQYPDNSNCLLIKLALQPTIETLTATLEVAERCQNKDNCLSKMTLDDK